MEILKRNLHRIAFFRPIIKGENKIENNINFMIKHFKLDLKYQDAFVYQIDEFEDLIAQDKTDEIIENIIQKYNYLEQNYDFVLIQGLSSFKQFLNYNINYLIAKNLNSGFINVINAKDKVIKDIQRDIEFENRAILQIGCNYFGSFIARVNLDRIEDFQILKDDNIFIIPEIQELNLPTVNDVIKELDAQLILGNKKQLNTIIKQNKVVAMNIEHFLAYIKEGDLIITSGDRTDVILGAISANYSKNYPSISAILLTSGLALDKIFLELLNSLTQFRIPILSVSTDTYDTVFNLQKVKARLSHTNHRKIALAIGTFNKYVNSDILESLIDTDCSDILTPLMFKYRLFQKARENIKTIVLPESGDERILRASEIIIRSRVAKIILLGDKNQIIKHSKSIGLDISKATIVNPNDSYLIKKYGKILYNLRKDRGLSLDMALDLITHFNYFATIMVKNGDADGMVSGAVHTTADTIRPALQIIKTKPNISIVSSLFFMSMDTKVLIYADCAINQNPSPEELAQIALSSVSTALSFGIDIKIAMLSYSTGESGSGLDVDKVVKATQIIKKLNPNLLIDGPIQYDAAIDPTVAIKKLPNSAVAGEATILIFPDLNTGNNTYKAVQRNSNAIAIGPILQGLNNPINDLSRGCKVEDIVNTVAITAIQAENNKN
jgi:phosphate acetyltransferase